MVIFLILCSKFCVYLIQSFSSQIISIASVIMADNETSNFLRQHGLERLIEIFVSEEIRLADFSFFRNHPEDLQLLLPRLRDRIDFIKAISTNTTKSTQVELEPPIICRETLTEICSRSDYGRSFIESYKIQNGVKVYSPDARKLVKMAMHDHRYKQQKPAVEPVPETSQKIPQTAWDKMSFEERSLCEAAKTKLLVTGYSESDIITKCWRESFPLRRKEALSGKIIFKDWEVLAHYANIHDLINFDFREVHGSSKDTLTTQAAKFIQVFSRVHIGYRELIKEDQTLADTIATSFAANVSINDHTVFLVFYSLPLILRQQFVTKQKKRTKISILVCRSSYIKLLETEAKVMECVSKRRQEALAAKTTVQPYVIVVGTVEEVRSFFVVLDELLFKCNSMVAAIDLQFKLHTAFHLNYAMECESVMQFLQLFFYDIAYPGDRFDANVTALATDCKRL
ncbi:uncharacterized protein LOC134217837 isoform X2 [Armigeres subalbatus]|uniref:uncharacterized protein LOC134217837 isoform X2 n=1 Tax=Armigeres subalbatus TaxID=124917 RepID=UPI002ED67511